MTGRLKMVPYSDDRLKYFFELAKWSELAKKRLLDVWMGLWWWKLKRASWKKIFSPLQFTLVFVRRITVMIHQFFFSCPHIGRQDEKNKPSTWRSILYLWKVVAGGWFTLDSSEVNSYKMHYRLGTLYSPAAMVDYRPAWMPWFSYNAFLFYPIHLQKGGMGNMTRMKRVYH